MTTSLHDTDKAEGSQLDRSTLIAIGLGNPPIWRQYRKETVLVTFSLAIALLSFALNLSPSASEQWIKALAAVSAGVALANTYLQWRAARHEASFDKYYDRLDRANSKFNEWRVAHLKNEPEDKLLSHLNTMFVFAEDIFNGGRAAGMTRPVAAPTPIAAAKVVPGAATDRVERERKRIPYLLN